MKNILIVGVMALSLAACGQQKQHIHSVGDVSVTGDTSQGGDAVDKIPAVKPVYIPPLKGDLGVKAQALPPLSGTDLEAQQRDAVDADRRYNDVAGRLNAVIDVYNCVRTAVNEKSHTVEECLK